MTLARTLTGSVTCSTPCFVHAAFRISLLSCFVCCLCSADGMFANASMSSVMSSKSRPGNQSGKQNKKATRKIWFETFENSTNQRTTSTCGTCATCALVLLALLGLLRRTCGTCKCAKPILVTKRDANADKAFSTGFQIVTRAGESFKVLFKIE